jgi:hypothetical protein
MEHEEKSIYARRSSDKLPRLAHPPVSAEAPEGAPLTLDDFQRWHEDFFKKHVDDDTARVAKLEGEFASLVRLLKVSTAIVVLLGGAVISIFLWVLLDKGAEFKQWQKTVTEIQQNQNKIISTQDMVSAILKMQDERDKVIYQMMRRGRP